VKRCYTFSSIGIVVPLKAPWAADSGFFPRSALEVREVRMGLEGVAVKMAMPIVPETS